MNGDTPPTPPADEFDPFLGGELEAVVPTTEPQREVWLASKSQPDASLAYNESVTLRLRGVLDETALLRGLQSVVDLHQALRATISPDGMSLCVSRHVSLDCARTDLAALGAAERDESLADARRRHVLEPFDLELGPLVRAELIRLAADDHALIFSAHHIVCDGWSLSVVISDLAEAYRNLSTSPATGLAPLPPGGDFASYAAERATFMESPDYAAIEQYWIRQFASGQPILELPTDHPRLAMRSFRSEREDLALEAGLVDRARRAGAREGASLFVTLLASFAALLHRLSGNRDFVIGVPAAGQNSEGRERLVGHLVHLLPLRVSVPEGATLTSLVRDLRVAVLDAFEHQAYTYGSLIRKLAVERDPGRPTLVGVTFNIDQPIALEGRFPGLEASLVSNPRAFENFDIAANLVHEGGGLRAEFQYGTEILAAATIRRWTDSWRAILEALATDPQQRVDALDVLAAADRDAWAGLNSTDSPFRRDASVPDLVLAQAARSPRAVAVTSRTGEITYGELAERTRALAAELRRRGVGPGDRVGISLERSPALLAAMLGTHVAGAAYVPLDPAFPRERLEFMASDADLKLILLDASSAALWDGGHSPTLRFDEWLAMNPAAPSEAEPFAAIDPRSAAYVIYTSGSTGKPKGVCVPHRAVVNFLETMRVRPGLSASDRLLAVTTLSFDIAVLELLLPLTVGAQIVLASRDDAIDGQALRELIEANGVTMLQATPSTWRLLLESGWAGTPTLRALCGGEALPADLGREIAVRVRELWNMYGPTETTVWSSCARIEATDAVVTIGTPIANTQFHVLDDSGNLCPIGVRGEIWIGGDGVALGYWKRPDLTAERFVADRFRASDGALLYRTGDVGFLRPDGTIECAGRTDHQVKIRGHRIELGEIESVLATHPDVARVVVDARSPSGTDRQLCAYVVLRPGCELEAAALREHVRAQLPEYMVPVSFTQIASVPLTPNGKVDRKALPSPLPVAATSTSSSHEPPQTEIERLLAGIWTQVLGMPQIGRYDNFFDLGGHSLLAMRAIAQMSERTGRRISPANYVLENLSQIAARYEAAAAPAASISQKEEPEPLFRRLLSSLKSKQR